MSEYGGSKMPQTVRNTFFRKSKNSESEDNHRSIPNMLFSPLLGNANRNNYCQLCQQHQANQSLNNCGHLFCRDCLHTYCIYKINMMEPLLCPKEGCLTIIDTEGAIYQILPEEVKEKYRQTELWIQNIQNKDKRMCPTENCEGIISNTQQFLQCPVCHVTFCKECLLRKHEGPCDQNFKKNFKNLRRCPKCRMFIEKNQGCDHMTCRCGHQFCYICQEDWQGGGDHTQCIMGQERGRGMLYLAQPHRIADQWQQQWPRNKQIYIVLLMFPLLPVFITLLLALWLLVVILGTIINFFTGPCVMTQQCASLRDWWILYPFLMIGGAIAAFFVGLFFGFGIMLFLIVEYCKVMCMLASGPQQRQQSGQVAREEVVHGQTIE